MAPASQTPGSHRGGAADPADDSRSHDGAPTHRYGVLRNGITRTFGADHRQRGVPKCGDHPRLPRLSSQPRYGAVNGGLGTRAPHGRRFPGLRFAGPPLGDDTRWRTVERHRRPEGRHSEPDHPSRVGHQAEPCARAPARPRPQTAGQRRHRPPIQRRHLVVRPLSWLHEQHLHPHPAGLNDPRRGDRTTYQLDGLLPARVLDV